VIIRGLTFHGLPARPPDTCSGLRALHATPPGTTKAEGGASAAGASDEDEQAAGPKDAVVVAEGVSDLDYLKARMSKWRDDDDEEEDDKDEDDEAGNGERTRASVGAAFVCGYTGCSLPSPHASLLACSRALALPCPVLSEVPSLLFFCTCCCPLALPPALKLLLMHSCT